MKSYLKWILLGLGIFAFGIFSGLSLDQLDVPKHWILVTSFILAILCSVLFFYYYRNRLASPYGLAAMYAKSLGRGRFDPPLPENGEPEAIELMRALNGLAQELRVKQETIQKLEALRIDFVANVSHELRTPLTSIRGYAETLRAGALSDPEMSVKFLERIEENADRLSRLISDLLDLSRYEKFPHDIEWSRFTTQSLREKLDSTFFPVFKKRNQVLEFQFQNQSIEGDLLKLEQVFINLIDNASRYNPEGTRVLLKQYDEPGYFVFEVSDNGQGIPKEHLPRLFERFYRVDKARSRDTGGTGLGLSIVKHIILSHGGQITVESDPKLGTKFSIKLPKQTT